MNANIALLNFLSETCPEIISFKGSVSFLIPEGINKEILKKDIRKYNPAAGIFETVIYTAEGKTDQLRIDLV